MDDESLGAAYTIEDIPSDCVEMIQEHREKMFGCCGRA